MLFVSTDRITGPHADLESFKSVIRFDDNVTGQADRGAEFPGCRAADCARALDRLVSVGIRLDPGCSGPDLSFSWLLAVPCFILRLLCGLVGWMSPPDGDVTVSCRSAGAAVPLSCEDSGHAHAPPLNSAAETAARVHALAAVRLRNGDEFVAAVDAKNEAYLYACLDGSSDTARVAWFETTDGCFIGLHLAHINAIFWSPPGSAAPKATAWDRDHLVVHFADKQSLELARISGDDIERLRRATISKHHATAFHTLWGRQNNSVSISIDTMTYITMPLAGLATALSRS